MEITFKTKEERFAYIQGMIDAKNILSKAAEQTMFLYEMLKVLEDKIIQIQCDVAEKDYGVDLRSFYKSLETATSEELKKLQEQCSFTLNLFKTKEEVGD